MSEQDVPALETISADASALQAVLQAALSAHSQPDWSQWLECELQAVLPHHVLIAAWGDFQFGEIAYDVITRHPALSVREMPADVIEPLARTLHAQWLATGKNPVVVDTLGCRSVGCALFSFSPFALVHGVRDHRTHYDCIYVFVGTAQLATRQSHAMCSLALPIVDLACRQLPGREDDGAALEPAQAGWAHALRAGTFPGNAARNGAVNGFDAGARADAGDRVNVLSDRELEVMKWVRIGKTNPEIAMILHLSMFTVKNHMRRIYRKLDVLNRAQAVASLDGMRPTWHAAPVPGDQHPHRGAHARTQGPR